MAITIAVLAGFFFGFALAYLIMEFRYRSAVRSLSRSFDVKKGKIVEQLAPYIRSFPYDPHDVRFIGAPVDFVVFDGLNSGKEVTIRFVEVKSGSSALNENERKVKEAVEKKRVFFEVLRFQ